MTDPTIAEQPDSTRESRRAERKRLLTIRDRSAAGAALGGDTVGGSPALRYDDASQEEANDIYATRRVLTRRVLPRHIPWAFVLSLIPIGFDKKRSP
jgi:hypothetical protein